jgi:5'-nucleotidase / UDP-sugar diphosphatase
MKSVFLLATALLVSCSQAPTQTKAKGVKLTILHTNDHHGRFWQNKDGEYGLAARATLIAQLREQAKNEGSHVLLLDAGDVNTGVPQSDLLNAEPDFKGMNLIGYDVMAIGNHEFDNPLKTLLMQQKEWAKFPFISANIYHNDGKRVFPSHITKELGGLKVVIFGLTTEDTPKKSKPEHSKGLRFKPAVEEARDLVPVLRKEADVLIALTHTGHYSDEKHGADAPGDVTIARQAKGIDVIIGGHTQKPLFEPDIQNGTLIVQAYEWGKYVGKIDLEVVEGKVNLMGYKLIPVNLKDSKEKIVPDSKMEAFLKPFKDQGDKSILIQIGQADQELIGRRDVIRSQETNLGNFVTKALKDKFKANLAIMNSGGIRDSIYPGKVTIESVLMILPFAGEIVTAELTGDELKKYIEYVVVKQTPGSGSFPQMSGVEAVVHKASGKLQTLKIEGKEVVGNKKYLMALPEFLADGGDNYPVVPKRKYGYVDADVLKEYIQKIKNLKAFDYATKGYVKFE